MARSRAGVAESFINGWRAVRLATDTIEVTVLPDKGRGHFALVDLASGIDPLFKAPWALAPPAGRLGQITGQGGRIRHLPPPLSAWTRARDVPVPPARTFREWWRHEHRDPA